MKKYLFTFILFSPILLLRAQDDNHFLNPLPTQQKFFSVSTDLLQYILVQPNIDVEYRRNNHVAFGINLAIVNPDPLFSVNFLSNGQYKWPGTIYNGEALRLYFKYSPKKPTGYWSAQAVIKYLWYNDVHFTDQIPGTDDPFYYTMNEKCTVIGLDILHGHEFGGAQSKLYVDLFYGLGIHDRIRDFTVFAPMNSYYLSGGYYKGYICYPTTVFGLKMGLKFPHKEVPAN